MRFRAGGLLGGSRFAQVHRDTARGVLASIVQQGLVLLSGVLVARLLGVEGRGHLALLWLVSLILSTLGQLGLPLALTYWIAKAPRLSRATVRSLVGPAALQAIVLLGLQAATLQLLVGDEDDSVRLAALFTLPLVPALLARQYALAIVLGQQRFRAFNLIRSLPLALYAVAVLALFVASTGNLPVLALTFTAVHVLTGSLSLQHALAGLPRVPSESDPPPVRSEMVRFGLKSMFGSTSSLESFQLDQAVVGLFISPAALGLYVVGLAFTNLPRFIARSIGFVAFPHVASHPDPVAARRAMWRFTALALVSCAAIVGALEATVGWLVPLLFGQEFSPSIEIARILLVSVLLAGVRRVLTEGARGAGHPGVGAVAEGVTWVCLVPAAAILAPAFGAKGVALALVASSALGLVGLVAALQRSSRKSPVPGFRS